MLAGRKLFFIIFSACLLVLSIAGPVDKLSDKYTDEAMSNAAVTFAVARLLNGVISVIQGTRLSATPAGIGVDVAAGEILDPVNDLLEQFSWLMLAATTSLGIQKILLAIGPSPAFQLIFTVAIAYFLLSLWSRNACLRASLAIKIVLVIAVLRFAIVLTVLLNQLMFQAFMQEDYETASSSLQKISADLERLNQGDAEAATDSSAQTVPDTDLQAQSPHETPQPKAGEQEGGGWFSAIKQFYSDTVDVVNPSKRIEAIKAVSTAMMNDIFKLLAIFCLQTILIPVVFLWLIYRVLRWIIASDFNTFLEADVSSFRQHGEGDS